MSGAAQGDLSQRHLRFYMVTLSKAQLSKIPTGERRYLLAASAAANDISNSQRRLLHGQPRGEQDPPDLIRLVTTQIYLSAVRNLAAQIYEFIKISKKFQTKLRHSKVLYPKLSSMFDDYVHLYGARTEFSFAEKLRHNVTNHYSGQALDLALEKFSDEHAFSMLLHPMTGHSVYLFAEEVGINSGPADQTLNFDTFIDWLLEASGSSSRLHQNAMAEILKRHVPEMAAMEKRVAVNEADLFTKSFREPVFFQPGDETV